MNRIPQILDSIHAHTGVNPNHFLASRDEESTWLRYVAAWICIRVAKIKSNHVASAFGATLSRNLVSYGCRKIDKAIIEQYPQTLDLIINVCKDSNLIQTKTGGTYSPSDLYNTLYAYLPSGRASMLRILGKISPTDTTASRQPSSVTSSHTKADNSTTPKADSHTSHTQRGTRSFYFTSDLNWAAKHSDTTSQPLPNSVKFTPLCSSRPHGEENAPTNTASACNSLKRFQIQYIQQ